MSSHRSSLSPGTGLANPSSSISSHSYAHAGKVAPSQQSYQDHQQDRHLPSSLPQPASSASLNLHHNPQRHQQYHQSQRPSASSPSSSSSSSAIASSYGAPPFHGMTFSPGMSSVERTAGLSPSNSGGSGAYHHYSRSTPPLSSSSAPPSGVQQHSRHHSNPHQHYPYYSQSHQSKRHNYESTSLLAHSLSAHSVSPSPSSPSPSSSSTHTQAAVTNRTSYHPTYSSSSSASSQRYRSNGGHSSLENSLSAGQTSNTHLSNSSNPYYPSRPSAPPSAAAPQQQGQGQGQEQGQAQDQPSAQNSARLQSQAQQPQGKERGSPVITGEVSKMEYPRKTPYHPRATIVLIGMRGVGKTTLGLIASTALGRRFVDLDSVLENATGMSVSAFVADNGWPAFREKEAQILSASLQRLPFDAVIACGGGVVESSECRRLLINAKETCPVIFVVRERGEVVKYLVDEKSRPSWGENIRDVWKRREPWFWECSSHVFVSLTASGSVNDPIAATSSHPTPNGTARIGRPLAPNHPLALKSVEQSFLRLIKFILSDPNAPSISLTKSPSTSRPSSPSVAPRLGNYPPTASSQHGGPRPVWPQPPDVTNRTSLLTTRTTFLSLTFPDLRKVPDSVFQDIVQGTDSLELRIDLWDCLRPASERVRKAEIEELKRNGQPIASLGPPEIDFSEVAIQVETARARAPGVPLLFTLRSHREGGTFYDDRDHAHGSMVSPHSEALYFKLADLALSMGTELLDVEMAWSPSLTAALMAKRGRTRILVSYHDLVGALRWETSTPRKLYERAISFGADIVQMIGTALKPESNWHALSYSSHCNLYALSDSKRRLPPVTCVNMGDKGKASRPFNQVLSPVSHPSQPMLAAPGQLSAREVTKLCSVLGIIARKNFFVFEAPNGPASSAGGDGGRISNIVSARDAAAVEAGFESLGLPYSLTSLPREAIANLVGSGGSAPSLPLEFSSKDFGGVFVAASCSSYAKNGSMQKSLLNLVIGDDAESSQQTLEAEIVGAADILTFEDLSQESIGQPPPSGPKWNKAGTGSGGLGTGGEKTPKTVTPGSGRLLAHHGMPDAIQSVIANNLSPINAPTGASTALIVVLPLLSQDEKDRGDERIKSDIAKKSALCAVARLGVGKCAILDLGDDAKAGDSSNTDGGKQQEAELGFSDGMQRWDKDLLRRLRRAQDLDHAGQSLSAPQTWGVGGGMLTSFNNEILCETVLIRWDQLKDLPLAFSQNGAGGAALSSLTNDGSGTTPSKTRPSTPMNATLSGDGLGVTSEDRNSSQKANGSQAANNLSNSSQSLLPNRVAQRSGTVRPPTIVILVGGNSHAQKEALRGLTDATEEHRAKLSSSSPPPDEKGGDLNPDTHQESGQERGEDDKRKKRRRIEGDDDRGDKKAQDANKSDRVGRGGGGGGGGGGEQTSAFRLPEEIWDTPTGGVLLRLPTCASHSFSPSWFGEGGKGKAQGRNEAAERDEEEMEMEEEDELEDEGVDSVVDRAKLSNRGNSSSSSKSTRNPNPTVSGKVSRRGRKVGGGGGRKSERKENDQVTPVIELPPDVPISQDPKGKGNQEAVTPTALAGRTRKEIHLDAQLNKHGWLDLGDEMLQLERLSRSVFQPLTMRKSPNPSLKTVWLAVTRASDRL